MKIQAILYAAIVTGFCVLPAHAGQVPKKPDIIIDDSGMIPKHETLTKDSVCSEQGHCIDKQDLLLECRNGATLHISVTQPRGAIASVTKFERNGKAADHGVMSSINDMLKDRPINAQVEVDGMCSTQGDAVYLDTYVDPYLKSRHHVGDQIMITALNDGSNHVQTRPVP